MADTQLHTGFESSALIRNEPVQARSAARLTALLDAAARVVDEIGYERLTTAMVAERAGASIGTVYRYFPDRIAVLQSLAARNAERTAQPVLAALADEHYDDWRSALAAAMEVFVRAFRDEPGFAAIRLGDVLDLRPATGAPASKVFADRAFGVLTERFGLDAGDDARTTFESIIVLSDALASRAFARDPRGDEAFLQQAVEATTALLGKHWS